MGRRAEGWKLKPNKIPYHVRFTWNNRRYEISTGETDRGQAEQRAAKIYSEVVNGRTVRQEQATSGLKLSDLLGAWLDQHPVRENTRKSYFGYARLWMGVWSHADEINREAIQLYWKDRLKSIVRGGVTKELHVLRAFLQWCVDEKYIAALPEVTLPPRKHTGTRSATGRKSDWVILTEEEALCITGALPEESDKSRGGYRFPVRSFFIFLWETGLRESTVYKLEKDVHWRPSFGNRLRVNAEIDKNSFKRAIVMSDAAVGAIEAALKIGDPERKFIWGEHDYRKQIAKACASCGIDPEKAENFSPYDFRHSRATIWGRQNNLVGMMHQLGWKETSTPSRYIHPQEEDAERLLIE